MLIFVVVLAKKWSKNSLFSCWSWWSSANTLFYSLVPVDLLTAFSDDNFFVIMLIGKDRFYKDLFEGEAQITWWEWIPSFDSLDREQGCVQPDVNHAALESLKGADDTRIRDLGSCVSQGMWNRAPYQCAPGIVGFLLRLNASFSYLTFNRFILTDAWDGVQLCLAAYWFRRGRWFQQDCIGYSTWRGAARPSVLPTREVLVARCAHPWFATRMTGRQPYS